MRTSIMFYINYQQLLMDGQNKFTVYIVFYTHMKKIVLKSTKLQTTCTASSLNIIS